MEKKTGPRAVFLVGFMGAGKTAVGQALAQRLGWRFLELDERVEAREKRSIAEIFRMSGEAAFRKAESAALQELLDGLDGSAPMVVALGGGASLQDENQRWLAEAGEPQVFLDAPVEVLRQRCLRAGGTRPLFENEDRFRQLYERRRPHYLRAALRVDTAGQSVEAVAAEIERKLRLVRQIAPGG